MAVSTEILYNGTKVICSENHRFGTDALLLARFSKPKRNWRVADLCSGCGIVSLEWHDQGHRGPCVAVEIAPDGSAQLADSIAEQEIAHIIPCREDLRVFSPEEKGLFELVACNPPYFEVQAGAQKNCSAHAVARHEKECNIVDVCACAARLLKDGGRFSMCHRPARLAEIFEALKAQRLEPKRLAFVKNKVDGTPWLFLVEAQKNRKVGLIVEPDILITAGSALY